MDTVVKGMLEDDELEEEKKISYTHITHFIEISSEIVGAKIERNLGNRKIIKIVVWLLYCLQWQYSLFRTIVQSDILAIPELEGLVIFGRDVSKIPCFRESFLYGIGTGVGMGLATFLKTSKPMLSQHVGVGMFSLSTMIYWSYCRWCWSQQRFDAQLLQEALKDKIIHEGTAVERELEQKGVLKSA